MTKSKHIPKRRFKEFELDGEWEQEKLGEISNITAGGDVVKEKLLTKGNYPVLANAHTNEGVIGYYEEDYQVEAPAVTVTGRGDIGFAKARKENFTPVVRLLSVKSEHNVDFLAEAINQNNVVFESTGVPQLTIPKLSKYKVYFPSTIGEENSIGNFLVSFDSLIALHQHKLDKLKNLKKAYLAELFPVEGERVPKRRFPGFEGEWEEKKLGEVVEFKRGLTYTPSSISKTGIRVLRSSNIDEDQFVLKEDDVFVDESKISIPFVEKGDILITAANGSSRLVGKHAIIDSTEKMVHGGFMLLAKSDQYKFINALLSSNWYTHFIDRSVLGGNGAIGNLSKSDLENEVPLFPSDEEQKQIGEFFQKIDKSISLQQQKLDKLKDLKKAYLNELFV